MKDGQQILNANIKLKGGYPTRIVKVQLKWIDGHPPGEVTVTAQAEKGDNPAARKISDGLYEFTLLQSASYTFSAWEDLDPQRLNQRHGQTTCTIPARINSDTQKIAATSSASDQAADANPNATGDPAANANDGAVDSPAGVPSAVTLTFANPPCN